MSVDPSRGTTRADWRRGPVAAREGPGRHFCARAAGSVGSRVGCEVTCGDLRSSCGGYSGPLQFRTRGPTLNANFHEVIAHPPISCATGASYGMEYSCFSAWSSTNCHMKV